MQQPYVPYDYASYDSVFTRHAILYKKLQRILIAFVLLFAIVIVAHGADVYSTLGALLLVGFATLPLLLWLSTPLRGLPIYPLFTLPFIWSYATPLIIDHPRVLLFSSLEQFSAAMFISAFLLLTTIIWWVCLQIRITPPEKYYRFDPDSFVPLCTTIVFIAFAYNVLNYVGLLGFGYSLQAITNIVIEVSSSLAAFILGYMWGQGRLSFRQKVLFLMIFLLTCFLQTMSFVLLAPVTKLVIVTTAVLFGGKRLNYFFLLVLIPLFILLHFGKYEMREKYWQAGAPRIGILDMPAVLVEWYGHSFTYLTSKEDDFGLELETVPDDTDRRRFLERLSLMHMFLEVKKLAGAEVPFFYGETYAVLFEALMPRLLFPSKVSSHYSMHAISIAYGHQTQEATASTHIAWGMVAEAWANFGLPGLFYLSIVLGFFFGMAHVWTRFLPLLSFRGCAGALICASSIQAHATTLTIFIISIVHSLLILLLIAFIFMKPYSRNH